MKKAVKVSFIMQIESEFEDKLINYQPINVLGSDCSESKISVSNELTKPFEMSDYYKYSLKFRLPPSQRCKFSLKVFIPYLFLNISVPAKLLFLISFYSRSTRRSKTHP